MKRKDKHQWMLDRMNDPYFIQAKKDGYRARSAYKLLEIHKKFNIIPKVGTVLDLGCAPGAWLQVLNEISNAVLVGIDLLNIAPVANTQFLQADIFSPEAEEFLLQKKFDLILSDIAPNCSGNKEHDHLRIMALAERVLELVAAILKPGAAFCIKIFDGRDTLEFLKLLRSAFERVKFFKPLSSSRESNEFYYVCFGFKKLTLES